MYTPRHFADAEEEGLALVRAHPFAVLLTADGGVSHAPLILDPAATSGTRLIGHLARANPHARAFEATGSVLAIFSGPEGYVSPRWYATKKAGGQTVPTWNYLAAHVTGQIVPLPEPADRRRAVDMLSRAMEGDGPDAWRLDDEPEDFIRKMTGGITAFAIEIAAVEAKAKLSQNRPLDDRLGVIDGLSERGNADLVAAMRARSLDQD